MPSCSTRCGRREEALAYYDKALAIKPDYAEALFNRGIVLRDLKRPAEALASFDRVLAIAPEDPMLTTIAAVRCET